MIETFCSALIYVFETLSCFFFFENYYNRKRKFSFCCICFTIIFGILFGVSFLSTPILNLTAFVLCYFVVSLFCYESKLKSSIFTSLILAVIMLITEMIVVHGLSAINKVDYTLYQDDFLTFVVQSSLSKLFYFVFLFIFTKLFNLKSNKIKANKFTILLGILPLVSVILLHSLSRLGTTSSFVSPYNTVLAISSILLLFANIFVFYVYETVQKINIENTQLKLESQRNEVSRELYEEMSQSLEKTRILSHDVKNHLSSIYDISEENNYTKVKEYVNSIYDDLAVNKKVTYSGNKMVDVIINRYVNKCESEGIFLEIESCCSELIFMSDVDIVSLLTNMFDNAIESAKESQERDILFSIYVRNKTFVIIQMVNSCDVPPESQNEKLISRKKDPLLHGVGTQSIRRIAEKYNGSFDWQYNELMRQFEASVILNIN